ncbi:MFS transporter [Corynebacterium sp. S7]
MAQAKLNRVYGAVLFLLFSAGWAANHFTTIMVLLREQVGVSSALVNGAYGIYALGLVPSLLGGGALADRFGARPVVVVGGLVAAAGNLALYFNHEGNELLLWRFIIGLGVGLSVSAGTAWAGRLKGASGMTMAGIMLTLGFATGPVAASTMAFFLEPDLNIEVPFIVTVALSLVSVLVTIVVGDARAPSEVVGTASQPTYKRSMGKALAIALPMAIWVFASIATALVILSSRTNSAFAPPVLLPGISAALAFGTGIVVQALGRKYAWGRHAGAAGASFAAIGFLLAAAGGASVPVWLFIIAAFILGSAYGLCLREGLLGVEKYSPPQSRGVAIGIYYVFTYIGFGLPRLFDVIVPVMGPSLPFIILAVLAVGSAVIREVQIRRGYID